MDEGLYTYISKAGVIVSPEPFSADIKASLESSYEVLAFQILLEKPMLCVCTSQYPVLYPGTMLVPESDWGTIKLDDHAILINEALLFAHSEKSSVEVTFVDLLSVFEMLTDAEKLLNFGDEHGLIVGASDARL